MAPVLRLFCNAGGRFISAHNRARNLSASVPRLSVPVFYDPGALSVHCCGVRPVVSVT